MMNLHIFEESRNHGCHGLHWFHGRCFPNHNSVNSIIL